MTSFVLEVERGHVARVLVRLVRDADGQAVLLAQVEYRHELTAEHVAVDGVARLVHHELVQVQVDLLEDAFRASTRTSAWRLRP